MAYCFVVCSLPFRFYALLSQTHGLLQAEGWELAEDEQKHLKIRKKFRTKNFLKAGLLKLLSYPVKKESVALRTVDSISLTEAPPCRRWICAIDLERWLRQKAIIPTCTSR